MKVILNMAITNYILLFPNNIYLFVEIVLIESAGDIIASTGLDTVIYMQIVCINFGQSSVKSVVHNLFWPVSACSL